MHLERPERGFSLLRPSLHTHLAEHRDGDSELLLRLLPAACLPGKFSECESVSELCIGYCEPPNLVKLIGVLKAEQGSFGKTIRKDRLLGVPVTEVNAAAFDEIEQLDTTTIDEIEHFFVAYNRAHGRRFHPLGRGGSREAAEIFRLAQARYAKETR